MTANPTEPVPRETLTEAAERIRAAVPIRARTATNDECAARRAAIDATLTARRTWQRERAWHTSQLTDGQVVGVWAHSPDEAELTLAVWWGHPCHWVIADPNGDVRAEYHPTGARTHGHQFPLAPPRRPRDQFALATSLLDPLGTPPWGTNPDR